MKEMSVESITHLLANIRWPCCRSAMECRLQKKTCLQAAGCTLLAVAGGIRLGVVKRVQCGSK
jgi:hypothetical protein